MAEQEDLEPHPDIHALFQHYAALYFGECLGTTSVQYSSARMTSCAGTCTYSRGGGCIIRLSEPLLKYRPSYDLKETLLHEMIHAYIHTRGIKGAGPDGHGPPFVRKMQEINASTAPDHQRPARGYHINTTHSFVAEVALYKTHHWQCRVCGHVIKRAMNRRPQPADCMSGAAIAKPCPDPGCRYCTHLRTCGEDTYDKTAEPEDYGKKKARKRGPPGPPPAFADGTPLPPKRPRGGAATGASSPPTSPGGMKDITQYFTRVGPEGAAPPGDVIDAQAASEREKRAAAAEARLQAQLLAAAGGDDGGDDKGKGPMGNDREKGREGVDKGKGPAQEEKGKGLAATGSDRAGKGSATSWDGAGQGAAPPGGEDVVVLSSDSEDTQPSLGDVTSPEEPGSSRAHARYWARQGR